MRRGSRVAFPLVQLAAAAVALGAWVVLARTQPESYQALPVQAFTVGVPVSLVLTAGIPYLLPNHFRGPVTSGRQGPWAVPVTLAVGAVAAAAASGVLLGLLGAPAAGAVLATAALLSAGVLVAQLARVRLALPLMLFGGLAAPLVPLVWLVVALLPGPSARAVVGVVLLGAAAALLGLLCVPWAAAPGDVTRAGAALAVRASAPLVLHLVAFGALLQGPRLAATLTGAGPGDVVDAHLLMLLLGAGATGVASVHAVLSVGLQTAADDGFERRRGRTARAYAVLGAGVSTVLLLVVLAGGRRAAAGPAPARPGRRGPRRGHHGGPGRVLLGERAAAARRARPGPRHRLAHGGHGVPGHGGGVARGHPARGGRPVRGGGAAAAGGAPARREPVVPAQRRSSTPSGA